MLILDELGPSLIGERLRLARGAAGLTQAVAASSINVARTTLIAIEQGSRRIRTEELRDLTHLYGTSLNAILRKSAVHVDLVARFREIAENDNEDIQVAVTSLTNLVKAEVELEQILGIGRARNYPPERSLLSGDVHIQAENDASELRHWLGLDSSPIPDLVTLLEMELGIRVFVRPLASRVSGLYAYDETVGACMLLNANHSRNRRNETGARELGHFVSSRNTPEILQAGKKGKSRVEQYAAAFAIAFLAPAREVARKFHQIPTGSPQLSRRQIILMAHTFGVSRELMVRRLEGLRLTKQGSWDWFESKGGITDQQARQILGEQFNSDPNEREIYAPTSWRLGLMAAEAWSQALLTEGQVAELLDLDRVSLRKFVGSMGHFDDQEDEASELHH